MTPPPWAAWPRGLSSGPRQPQVSAVVGCPDSGSESHPGSMEFFTWHWKLDGHWAMGTEIERMCPVLWWGQGRSLPGGQRGGSRTSLERERVLSRGWWGRTTGRRGPTVRAVGYLGSGGGGVQVGRQTGRNHPCSLEAKKEKVAARIPGTFLCVYVCLSVCSFKLYLFIYWLCWVFVAVCGHFSGCGKQGLLWLWCTDFSLQWLLVLQSTVCRWMIQ